ncbi:GntR family transcriptional regulator [Arthrobacter methylotrophus]|uniref:GntR family transcriptional regulator n=1 Tax=Arthrobacter methylotrophus TaxID=121291 RepID=A0ABV5UJP8_9MICC
MDASGKDRPEALVPFLIRRIQEVVGQGGYPPGSRLSPSALAKEFGVSHIPVREALSSLAAKGHIVHRQSRGFYTRELSRQEIEDIYHWRRVLETEAYKLAVPLITDDDIEEMRAITEETASLKEHAERVRFVELNRQFHFVAFRRAGSPVLLKLLNQLWDNAAPYVVLDLVDSTRAQDDHIEQIKLFETHDLKAILAAMENHRGFRLDMVKKSERVSA